MSGAFHCSAAEFYVGADDLGWPCAMTLDAPDGLEALSGERDVGLGFDGLP